MYYRHAPGAAARLLSRPGVYPLARGLFLAGNRVAGGVGNKLAVQAVRERSPRPPAEQTAEEPLAGVAQR